MHNDSKLWSSKRKSGNSEKPNNKSERIESNRITFEFYSSVKKN